MQKPNKPILPTWLSFALSLGFVFSSIAVLIFAYLTFEVVWNRPVNPVEAAAEEVADVDLAMEQVGTAPVPTLPVGQPTPTLIPTQEF